MESNLGLLLEFGLEKGVAFFFKVLEIIYKSLFEVFLALKRLIEQNGSLSILVGAVLHRCLMQNFAILLFGDDAVQSFVLLCNKLIAEVFPTDHAKLGKCLDLALRNHVVGIRRPSLDDLELL